jgi:L-fuconolactonase
MASTIGEDADAGSGSGSAAVATGRRRGRACPGARIGGGDGAVLTLPAVDAHQQFWDPEWAHHHPLAPELATFRRTFGPDDLLPELELEGMTGSVLVQALPSLSETHELLALAAALPFVLGVVGWLDLTRPDVAEVIDELRAGPGGGRLVGLCHCLHDEVDGEWLARADVRRGLAAVAAAGLPFDIAVRTPALPAVYRAAESLPNLRFVLDHLARPPIASGDLTAWGRAMLTLAELPNVHAKLSGLVTEADWHTWCIDDLRHPVELAVDAFGAERLMLGSDWPRCLLAGSYSDAIESVRYLVAELTAYEQAEIRGGTAARVYRLDLARA